MKDVYRVGRCNSACLFFCFFRSTFFNFDLTPANLDDRNTDKMTDEEKLPIAIAGVAFITLPFIAGLIALYAAQGN